MNPIGQAFPVIHMHLVVTPIIQYNGGSLPGIILLTQGYYHWGTHLNAMKRLYF